MQLYKWFYIRVQVYALTQVLQQRKYLGVWLDSRLFYKAYAEHHA